VTSAAESPLCEVSRRSVVTRLEPRRGPRFRRKNRNGLEAQTPIEVRGAERHRPLDRLCIHQIDIAVRSTLAQRRMKKGDLSQLTEDGVRSRVLDHTLIESRGDFADLSGWYGWHLPITARSA
jgi:hypothetical protein